MMLADDIVGVLNVCRLLRYIWFLVALWTSKVAFLRGLFKEGQQQYNLMYPMQYFWKRNNIRNQQNTKQTSCRSDV